MPQPIQLPPAPISAAAVEAEASGSLPGKPEEQAPAVAQPSMGGTEEHKRRISAETATDVSAAAAQEAQAAAAAMVKAKRPAGAVIECSPVCRAGDQTAETGIKSLL